jgi:hypothetical protein
MHALCVLAIEKRQNVFMEFVLALHLTEKTNFMKHLNLSIPQPSRIRGFKLLSVGTACVLLMITGKPAFSQAASVKEQIELAKLRDSEGVTSGHTVSGTVRDKYGEPMAGASIYLKGTTEGTTTDAEGHFEFPGKLQEGDILTFSFIGHESVEYAVKGSADEYIEISMREDVTIIGDLAVDDVYTTKTGLRQFFRKIF